MIRDLPNSTPRRPIGSNIAYRGDLGCQRFGFGPAIMPSRRSHQAPYFSGKFGDPIEDFLVQYEELANCCGLTDREKVRIVTRYIPLSLHYFWMSLDGYKARNWTDLRRELKDAYKDSSAVNCHMEQEHHSKIRRADHAPTSVPVSPHVSMPPPAPPPQPQPITMLPHPNPQTTSNPDPFFDIFAAEREKHETRAYKLSVPRRSDPIATPSASAPAASTACPVSTAVPFPPATATAQPNLPCHHQSATEDQQLITESQNGPMEVKPTQTTPPHAPVASPTVRKELVECPQVRRMETSSRKETSDAVYTNATMQRTQARSQNESVPPCEIVVTIRDSSIPLHVNSTANHSCHPPPNLFTGHGHCTVNAASQDLATVRSLLSTVPLSALSTVWTNTGTAVYAAVTSTSVLATCCSAWLYLDNG